jgi:Cd2+/Zn2+-exporting ATPase
MNVTEPWPWQQFCISHLYYFRPPCTNYFVSICCTVVVASALLIAVIPLAAGSHRHKHWIYLALVLLVVACPCALVISTPVTTTCGIAQAARSGLLVRGGSHLEALANVKVLALDKTGTVTEGHFRVLDVRPADSAISVKEILYW